MTTSTVQALMAQMSGQTPCTGKNNFDKVSVIGAGSVGAACLFALVAERISNELVLIDKDLSLVRDELIDIQNASVFMGQPNLTFSIVPVWSSVSACGIRLRDINPLLGTDDDPEDWEHLFKDIIQSSYNIMKTKSFNTWGIAASVANIIHCILWNTRECISVSTHIKGCRHGVDKEKDVFMSLPCIIGANGVNYIVRQTLSENEKEKLQESADTLNELQANLDL